MIELSTPPALVDRSVEVWYVCAGGVRWPAAGGRRRQVGARPRDEWLAFYCVCMLDAADADSNLLFLLYAYALL